jgi:3-phenylpropionate/trans-cinnamate dioxygenase ferredoxin subunit
VSNELSEATYQRVCAVSELSDDQPLGLEIGGEPVVIVRTGDEYFALRDVCSHAEVALSDGEIDSDCSIECWLHGSRFDLRTGEPLELPATEPVQTYPVKVEGDDVLVALASPQ